MSDIILYMAADYEAVKFCKRVYTVADIQKLTRRHFAYSCLLADSVVIPAGCYFESDHATNLVDAYHVLFKPNDSARAIAGLSIGDNRESFYDDIRIKADWFPASYSFSDSERMSMLSKRLEDIEPTIRTGKMRNMLTRKILEDIDLKGNSFQTIQQSGFSCKEAEKLVRPLYTIVNEQKYAILPPYIRMEMEKQDKSINKVAQKRWLDFVLFKNYVVSCEEAYLAYCNNPLSLCYDELLKTIYTFKVDYRDTLLFEQFLSLFPLQELVEIEKLSPDRLYQLKRQDKIKHYITCYKEVVEHIREELSFYVLRQDYERIGSVLGKEQNREIDVFKKQFVIENTFEAEALYRAFHKPFLLSRARKTNEFRRWINTRNMDLPLVQILAIIEDDKEGILGAFIKELAVAAEIKHKEEQAKMSKNTILGIINIKPKQVIKEGKNSPHQNAVNDSKTMGKVASDTSLTDAKPPIKERLSRRRFAIALSFPGEHRDFVECVADILSNCFGRERILYDKYHQIEFSRVNLDLHLLKLYSEESDIVVVFLCDEYDKKPWCGIEWRAIRRLLNDKSAQSRIMPIKIGGGMVEGLSGSTDGWLPAENMTPDEVAVCIIKRYNMM